MCRPNVSKLLLKLINRISIAVGTSLLPSVVLLSSLSMAVLRQYRASICMNCVRRLPKGPKKQSGFDSFCACVMEMSYTNNINRIIIHISQIERPDMSCFIGFSIDSPLSPTTYQSSLSQIEDYISETEFQIAPHSTLLIIATKYQKFYLPKDPAYLHSNLQHFMVSQTNDQHFVETVVECLMILKQHFPHKVEVELISELEQIFNLRVKVQQEIPRRLIGHLKILGDRTKKSPLTEEQLHMLVANLETEFHKDYKQKIISLSLKILAQGKVQAKTWGSLSKQQIKIIDQVVNQPTHQKVGIQILQRIVRNNNFQVFSFSDKKQNQSPNSNSSSQTFPGQQAIPEYEGPLDPMTALFQLKQSMNIGRVSWIIQHVDCQKLSEKKLGKFDARIRATAEKFLNGYYTDVPLSHAHYFGRCLAEYEMRRSNLSWDGLVEEVLIKIEQKQKEKFQKRSNLQQN